jgi:hypothetical protein
MAVNFNANSVNLLREKIFQSTSKHSPWFKGKPQSQFKGKIIVIFCKFSHIFKGKIVIN